MAHKAEILLKAQGICKSFSHHPVLKGVDLTLYKGEVHFLAGENGAGKSTLMKILVGQITCDQGEIIKNGAIAMIHQELSCLDNLTVAENFFLGRELKKFGPWIDKKKQNIKCQEWCQSIGLDIDPNLKVSELSLAQKSFLEVAKVISTQADIIIMDEPTSALPEKEARSLFEIIKKLKNEGKAIIYISHKMDELKIVSDQVSVLRDGQLVSTNSIKDFNQDLFYNDLVGRPLGEHFPASNSKESKEIQFCARKLSLKNPDKDLSSKRPYIFKDISFDLKKGEILGIAGLEGAGHHELLRQIYLDHQNSTHPQLAYLPSDRKKEGVILEHSIVDNIVLASLKKYSQGPWCNQKKMIKEAQDQKQKLSIKAYSLFQKVGELSGGNQQKVVLAKGLLMNPDILLLDGPTRGIDIGAKQEIYHLLRELTAKGVSVLMYSSELTELIGLCDRIMVLHQGELQAINKVTLENKNLMQEKIIQQALGVDYESQDNRFKMGTSSKSSAGPCAGSPAGMPI